ncbi:hypothetical protein [uncultured Aliiroseovarius sp.]|uniref:hypothetical protein n=1 Tax=uncultured Aliiroseovarius sp. TaxID=1658783 RepID=UPI002628987B|nr:hypothetical protein [uncultured Aliiroseovarius sp.]
MFQNVLRRYFAPRTLKIALYFTDARALAIPHVTRPFAIPEAIFPGVDCYSLNTVEIGQTIKQAVQQCAFKRSKGPKLDLLQSVGWFEAEMDKFREANELTERQFHQQLRLVDIELAKNQYLFWPQKRTQRRFAFEAACKSEGRSSSPEDTEAALLGEIILKVMARSS